MYEAFFGLNDRPFIPAPLAKRYFPAKASETARQTLARCIERGEGIALLIGSAGMGKTLLCQVLADQFRPRMTIAHLSSSRLASPRNLFQAILYELGFPYRGLAEGELRLSLEEHLTRNDSHGGGLLLLVDEAHLLARRLLEELRLLTNLLRGGQPRVRIVLAGGAALDERLASAKLESLTQRIAARRYLQAFEHDETLAYLRKEITSAGGQVEQIFTADALHAIHRTTDGIPRLINQVCDHALVMAFAGGVRPINEAGIEEAWADLQQLPAQWPPAAARDPAPDIIEFGALEDDVLPMPSVVEKAATPQLRAIGGDEADLYRGEPGDRIEKIEAQLDALDGDFLPSTGELPQVELVFADPGDPFAESFEDEEVVVDHFARLDINVLADRPQVRSREGRELAAVLEPLMGSDAGGAARGRGRDEFAATNRPLLRPGDDPVLPEESDAVSLMIASIEETVPLQRSGIGDAEHTIAVAEMAEMESELPVSTDAMEPLADEADLIVIEDDPSEPEPPTPKPPKARRQEYRQLFARLRRG